MTTNLTPTRIASLEGHRVRVTDHDARACYTGTAAPLFRGGPSFFAGLKLDNPIQTEYHARNSERASNWAPEHPVNWIAQDNLNIEIEIIE